MFWSVALGIAGGLWAFSSPVGGVPDEPAHIVYAWGVATGQGFGDADIACGDDLIPCPAAQFEVPGGLIPRPGCYAFKPAVPAGCQLFADAGVHATTAVRYPPMYYVAVGLAMRGSIALGFSGESAGSLARLTSVLISISLLAPALALASKHATRLIPTIVVLLTPMSLFMIAAINPSGAEISAAIAAATALVVLSRARSSRPAVWLFVYAITWLTWTRPIGLIWTGAISLFGILYLAMRVDRAGLRAAVRDHRTVVGAATINLVGGAGWFWYATRVHGSGTSLGRATLPDRGVEEVLALALRWGELIRENLGVLGWLDTPMPTPLLLGTAAGIAILTYEPLRASGANRKQIHVSVAYLVTIVIGVTALMRQQEFLWQGRYALPALAAGLVFIAGAAPSSGRRSTRRVATLAWMVATAGAFWLYARHVYGLQVGPRYVVPNVSDDAQWFGPLGGVGFVVIGALASLGVPLLMRWISTPRSAIRSEAEGDLPVVGVAPLIDG